MFICNTEFRSAFAQPAYQCLIAPLFGKLNAFFSASLSWFSLLLLKKEKEKEKEGSKQITSLP